MLSFIARRLAALLPVLGVVSLVVFLILRLAPGDPAAVIAGAAERLRCDLVVLPLRDTQLRRNVLALATFHWDVMLVDGGTPEERAT